MISGKAMRRLHSTLTAGRRRTVSLKSAPYQGSLPGLSSLSSGPSFSHYGAGKRERRFLSTSPMKDEDESVVETPQPVKDEGKKSAESFDELNPRGMMERLDQYIIGQADAKRAVAVALRNRWRRQQLPEDLRNEVMPRNILMIGPTGCGKTEIARRIAKLLDAPFIKVEATKFTEVGFHGRDVDQIIRDLVDISIALTKKKATERIRKEVAEKVDEHILDILVGPQATGEIRESFRNMLKQGRLDTREIEIEVPTERGGPSIAFDSIGGLQVETIVAKLQGMREKGKNKEKKRLPISEARPIIEEMEMEKQMDMGDVTKEAVKQVEENGIVFLDEIDKIVNTSEYRGADASAEGVQRDLLPLIEGSSISTKHGNVNTDHILFIASGAFHSCKPSDLMAELQGRLPIRVELKGLTVTDLYRILTEPVTNILRQQKELMRTEDVNLEFTEEAIREIARLAAELNQTVENIGARRLHTVIERIVEDISFAGPELKGQTVTVDLEMVNKKLADMLKKNDLSKFIL